MARFLPQRRLLFKHQELVHDVHGDASRFKVWSSSVKFAYVVPVWPLVICGSGLAGEVIRLIGKRSIIDLSLENLEVRNGK